MRPGTVLLDVRRAWRYRRWHVPGSHSIPAGLLVAGELPDGDLLLIGSDSMQAHALIEQLHAQGSNRLIRYLEGGFPAWKAEQQNSPTHQRQGIEILGHSLWGWLALQIAADFMESLRLLGLTVLRLLGTWAIARSRA